VPSTVCYKLLLTFNDPYKILLSSSLGRSDCTKMISVILSYTADHPLEAVCQWTDLLYRCI